MKRKHTIDQGPVTLQQPKKQRSITDLDIQKLTETIRRKEGDDFVQYTFGEVIHDCTSILEYWKVIPTEVLQFYGQLKLSDEDKQVLIDERRRRANQVQFPQEDLNLGIKCAYKKVTMSFPEHDDEEDVIVHTGDFVRVSAEMPHEQIMQVDVIFLDHLGELFVKNWWYYKDFDTPLNVPLRDKSENQKNNNTDVDIGNGQDRRIPFVDTFGNRLWMATPQDNERFYPVNKLATVDKVVKVYYVPPDAPPLPYIKDVYWFDQQTCLQQWNFESIPNPPVLPKEKKLENTDKNSKNPKKKQILRVLDIYSGCGGMGYICQASDDEVEIQHRWSCDIEESMVYAIKLNDPNTVTFAMSVDELLKYSQWLCELKLHMKSFGFNIRSFKEVQDEHPKSVYGVIDVKMWPRIEKFGLNMRFLVGNIFTKRGQWFSMEELLDDQPQIFADWLERQTVIPVPGNVDVVIGGPPCQGISGLNRHAQEVQILNDPRNSQVISYSKVIQWFEPRYCLMEQVQNIVNKEHGEYLKFAQVMLLLPRYQTRVGVCYAGHYGCPQTRVRVFMWGAAPGEQLPPYPAPVHLISKSLATFNACEPLFVNIKDVNDPSLLPSIRIGDIAFDIPTLSNYTHGEVRKRNTTLLSPYQLWLQRQPTNKKVLEDRNKVIGHVPAPVLKMAMKDGSILSFLGSLYQCKKNWTEGSSHSAKTVQAFIKNYGNQLGNKSHRNYMREFRQHGIQSVGVQVLQDLLDGEQYRQKFEAELSSGSDMKDWVTDCVPLRCNNDDMWRMMGVPVGSGTSFRNMKGLCNDTVKGYCCAGHHHAFRFPINDKQAARERGILGSKFVFEDPGDGKIISLNPKVKKKDPLQSIEAKLNQQTLSSVEKSQKNSEKPIIPDDMDIDIPDTSNIPSSSNQTDIPSSSNQTDTRSKSKKNSAQKSLSNKVTKKVTINSRQKSTSKKITKKSNNSSNSNTAIQNLSDIQEIEDMDIDMPDTSNIPSSSNQTDTRSNSQKNSAQKSLSKKVTKKVAINSRQKNTSKNITKKSNNSSSNSAVQNLSDIQEIEDMDIDEEIDDATNAKNAGSRNSKKVSQKTVRGKSRKNNKVVDYCESEDEDSDEGQGEVESPRGKQRKNRQMVYTTCQGGGFLKRPVSSREKTGRVDYVAKDLPGITELEGCAAKCTFIPSMDLLVPRWCVTYKEGKNGRYIPNPSTDIYDFVKTSRNVCYGRLWYSDVVATVVTRAEPHNLQVVHPTQPRVMSPREFARCQGFPDHHILAFDGMQDGWLGMEDVRSNNINMRYMQVGNAVAPLQAAYLGQCMKLAAKKQVQPEQYVVRVRHAPYEDLIKKGMNEMGLKFWDCIRKDAPSARNQSVTDLAVEMDAGDADETS